MTKQSITPGRSTLNLKWALCLGALPFVYAITGCGTSNQHCNHGEYNSAMCSKSSMKNHSGMHHWDMQRTIKFSYNSSEINSSEMPKIHEIAEELKENDAAMIKLDGFIDPRNMDLSQNRIRHIREALVHAGVSARRIEDGSYGIKHIPSDRSVSVMICKKHSMK